MVALVFALLYPFLYFFSRKESRYPQLNFFRKLCAWLPSTLSGIFYSYEFRREIDWSRIYIVCPNHSSNLDIFALSVMMKNNFFFLGKDELAKNPLTAIFFNSIDVPINRESKMASFRAFRKTAEKLEKGMSAVIFPEGKIGEEYPPVLHPFKSGPFKLAIQHKIPILPVSIKNNWRLMWDDGGRYGGKPGISNIYIHEPIETSEMDIANEDELKDLVYERIISALNYNK